MKSYIIPAKKYENNLAIIHCGTNDLRENKNAEQIAKNIIELATDMKTNNNNIMVSGIIHRNDKWNQKAMEVNSFLKSFCLNCKFYFIDNTNIAKDTHLNSSGLHLNHKGTYILGSNLVDAICLWLPSYACAPLVVVPQNHADHVKGSNKIYVNTKTSGDIKNVEDDNPCPTEIFQNLKIQNIGRNVIAQLNKLDSQ